MHLRTVVTRQISDIPKENWDAVFPDILESYDFFRAIDASALLQFAMYYIMVYDKKTPVGAFPCFLVDYSLDTSIVGPLKRITGSIKRIMPNIFSLRVLVCGMPIGQSRFGVKRETDKVLKVVLRRMEQLAKKNRAAIVAFKDFDHSYCAALDPLQKDGFKKIEGLPNTELNVWFRDFEEYLNTLSGATRYDLRRKFKKVDGKVSINFEETVHLDNETLKDVYRLYLDMVKRHDMSFEILPPEFFLEVSRKMTDKVKFFLWRIDGKLVTFLLCLVKEDILIDYYVGLDYDVAHRYHLYFVKFRDILNWCIRHKIQKYEMGFTGYEAKVRLGFDLVPLYLYVRLQNRLLRPVFRLLCELLKFENFDPALKEAKRKIKDGK